MSFILSTSIVVILKISRRDYDMRKKVMTRI